MIVILGLVALLYVVCMSALLIGLCRAAAKADSALKLKATPAEAASAGTAPGSDPASAWGAV